MLLIIPTLLTLLASLQLSHARDRLGLKAHRPSEKLARKAAKEARAAEKQLQLDRRWANETGHKDYRYYNNQTSDYFISSLPDINFDLGEIYSGLIPIDYSNSSEALFFVFQPTIGAPVDEVTIWLNGGPGCSSLEGFLQEIGLFTWQPGTYEPVVNQYSWVNLTNVLWVEQPVGTGFSIGTPKATNQGDIAVDFLKFFKNFQDKFGIKNYKIYVTGESYAGRYVPYISGAMIDANDTGYYNLQGAMVYDPCIGEFVSVQEQIPAYPFVVDNYNLFNFNDTLMSSLKTAHQQCGYADYIERYYKFPPTENQPPLYFNYSSNSSCDVSDMVNYAAFDVNPCFDIYEVNLMCPILSDVIGFPTELVDNPYKTNYFNRSDVKAAMHAPDYVNWAECAVDPVFVGGDVGPQGEGDTSPDPIQGVLPKVIEHTNRVLIGNGDYDMVIITNGTLLSIQNMTWNGKLGFQSKPSKAFRVDLPDLQYQAVFEANGLNATTQGELGISHYERGLMWVETFQSGHMVPQYQARAAYKHISWLLGRIDDL